MANAILNFHFDFLHPSLSGAFGNISFLNFFSQAEESKLLLHRNQSNRFPHPQVLSSFGTPRKELKTQFFHR